MLIEPGQRAYIDLWQTKAGGYVFEAASEESNLIYIDLTPIEAVKLWSAMGKVLFPDSNITVT